MELGYAGMIFDGMYFHYIDKMIYAMYSYARLNNDYEILVEAAELIVDVHPAVCFGQGTRWKLNIDLSPIESINVNPSSDALSAWIMYNLVQTLSEELRKDTSIAAQYTAKSPIVWQYFLCSAQQSIGPIGIRHGIIRFPVAFIDK